MGIRIPTVVQDNVAVRCDGCLEVIDGTPWRVNVLDIVSTEVAAPWDETPAINPGPFQFHSDEAHVRRWMADRGYLFCRKGRIREIMRPIPVPSTDGASVRWDSPRPGRSRDDHELIPAWPAGRAASDRAAGAQFDASWSGADNPLSAARRRTGLPTFLVIRPCRPVPVASVHATDTAVPGPGEATMSRPGTSAGPGRPDRAPSRPWRCRRFSAASGRSSGPRHGTTLPAGGLRRQIAYAGHRRAARRPAGAPDRSDRRSRGLRDDGRALVAALVAHLDTMEDGPGPRRGRSGPPTRSRPGRAAGDPLADAVSLFSRAPPFLELRAIARRRASRPVSP
jgi:hypothetical protein